MWTSESSGWNHKWLGSLVGLSLGSIVLPSLRVCPQTSTKSSCALNVKLHIFYNIYTFKIMIAKIGIPREAAAAGDVERPPPARGGRGHSAARRGLAPCLPHPRAQRRRSAEGAGARSGRGGARGAGPRDAAAAGTRARGPRHPAAA